MKKIIPIACLLGLLCVGAVWGWMGVHVAGSGGAAAPAGSIVVDDFSSDTSANYTAISGSISISSGVAHGTAWDTSILYHESTLGDANHWTQAKIMAGVDDGEYSGILLRCNGTSYVEVFIRAGILNATDNAGNWSATYNGSYSDMTQYLVKATLSSTNIVVTVDGVERINYSHASNNLTGTYAGVKWKRGSANGDMTIDDLEAN